MTVNIPRLIADLRSDEGERLYVYDDATGLPIEKGTTVQGHPTVGIGRLLTKARGISADESRLLLQNDVAVVLDELDRRIPWWRSLPEPQARALANQCFQLGWPRLSGFRNMLAALENRDFHKAAAESLDSRWAEQTPARAKRIAALYRDV